MCCVYEKIEDYLLPVYPRDVAMATILRSAQSRQVTNLQLKFRKK